MNHRLSGLALGILTISLIISPPKLKAMGGSGPYEGLKDSAKRTLIAVETPASSGSGIVVGRRGNTYYFLTASHVAQGDPRNEEFYAYLSNGSGKRYQIKSIERPAELRSYDIVIGSFESADTIDRALIFPLDNSEGILPEQFGKTTLGTDLFTSIDSWIAEGRPWKVIKQGMKYSWIAWKSFNGRPYDKNWSIQGYPIVAGVSIPTKSIPVAITRFSSAELFARVPGNKDGYEAVYTTTSTVPGMSGGGLFAARACPDLIVMERENNNPRFEDLGLYAGVIAMHGRSEEYGSSGGRSGASLGVPMILLKNYLTTNSNRYGIPIGQEYKDIVLGYCINKSFDQ